MPSRYPHTASPAQLRGHTLRNRVVFEADSVGRERQWGDDRFTPTDKPRRMPGVDGGVAGLEATRGWFELEFWAP